MGVAVALEMLKPFVGFEANGALVSGTEWKFMSTTVVIVSRWLHN